MRNAMRLYFYRHAPALSRAEWDGPDSERPLSTDGTDIARGMSRRIAGMGLAIDAIISSPYARAWRTAEILAEELDSPGLLEANRGLEPGAFDLHQLEALIASHEGASGLVIIGHEPSMTAVIADTLGGGDMVLKKAGLARVDLDTTNPASGTLRWLAPPQLLI